MKNSHLHPLEGTGSPEVDNRVEFVKKEWNKPEVVEISRFSILGGGDPIKTEASSTPIASL